jgi:COP9 signalosome complex subunit 5
LGKVEDWGVHADQYYSLDVSFFKSSLDSRLLELLWNKYWVHTLSASPLAVNRAFVAGQLGDLAAKLEVAEAAQQHFSAGSGGFATRSVIARRQGEDSQMVKIARDASKATLEQSKGLASQIVKAQLFNFKPPPLPAGSSDQPMPDAEAV